MSARANIPLTDSIKSFQVKLSGTITEGRELIGKISLLPPLRYDNRPTENIKTSIFIGANYYSEKTNLSLLCDDQIPTEVFENPRKNVRNNLTVRLRGNATGEFEGILTVWCIEEAPENESPVEVLTETNNLIETTTLSDVGIESFWKIIISE